MEIVFFGTPGFAVPTLQRLIGSPHEVLAVVTQPDRQAGRGRKVVPSPVKYEAGRTGIKVMQPQRVRDDSFIKELRNLKASCIVVVAYGQILPSEIIRMPEHGCINVHASLLPKYRGAAPINWAIIRGEKITGITIMQMDEGMDTGDILQQEDVEIYDTDTAGSLSERLSRLGADMILPALEGIERGTIRPVPQTGEASYAPLLKKSDGLINWNKPAEDICNMIRGMNPWPGAYSFINGERVKIIGAVPVYESGSRGSAVDKGRTEAGVIEELSKDQLLVRAADDLISILEIQPSGKPVMSVESFLSGRSLSRGMAFGDRM